jgi:hypothetical protein
MRVSAAIVTASTILFSLAPAGAEAFYPTRPCRVYVDTAYTQIPGQCGTVWRSYPRKLLVTATREFSLRRSYAAPRSYRPSSISFSGEGPVAGCYGFDHGPFYSPHSCIIPYPCAYYGTCK